MRSAHALTKCHDMAGARVNKKDERGWTPLHFAVKGGHSKCVKILLRGFANPSAADDGGWTPLLEVCIRDWATVAVPQPEGSRDLTLHFNPKRTAATILRIACGLTRWHAHAGLLGRSLRNIAAAA